MSFAQMSLPANVTKPGRLPWSRERHPILKPFSTFVPGAGSRLDRHHERRLAPLHPHFRINRFSHRSRQQRKNHQRAGDNFPSLSLTVVQNKLLPLFAVL